MTAVAAWNWLDWMLAGILLYSTLAAFMRGFFREVFSLIGIAAGILLASWNYPRVAIWLTRWLPVPVSDVISFLAIALAVMLACALIGRVLAKTARTVGLGFVDRLLGAAFGLARGFLLGVAILTAAVAFVPDAVYLKHSRLSSCFLVGAHGLSFVVPANLEHRIRIGTDRVERKARPGATKLKPRGPAQECTIGRSRKGSRRDTIGDRTSDSAVQLEWVWGAGAVSARSEGAVEA